MYDYSNQQMFEHIKVCEGVKDIITTRWYKVEELVRPKGKEKVTIIEPSQRPITR
tara:strand:+ start:547 stop:711 length:165 start_codon:yes stop_codon:yes gene_type:complete